MIKTYVAFDIETTGLDIETEEIIEYDPFHKINYKRKEALILPRTFPSSVLSKILNYAYTSFNSNSIKTSLLKKLLLRCYASILLSKLRFNTIYRPFLTIYFQKCRIFV